MSEGRVRADDCALLRLQEIAMTHFKLAASMAVCAVLAACGGSNDDKSEQGSLVEAPVTVTTLTAAQIDASTASSGLQVLSGKAKCDVKVVALNYRTRGPANEDTNASGALLVPTGTGAGCTAAAPLIAYAKGTDVQKPR